jgi:fatty acid desaturase
MGSRIKATDVLSREEIARLTTPSSLMGAWAVLSTWAIIAGVFAGLAWLPHPLTFALAVVVLGGRQLALAVLMHEAAHRSLFRGRWWNDVFTNWACARPVWGDVARYRAHHVAHHAHTGTDRDPDRGLAAPFPVRRASLLRKIARDLLFVSGLKRLLGLVLMDLELLAYNVSGDAVRNSDGPTRARGRLAALLRNAGGVVLTNAALFGALWAAGHGRLYLVWVVAWLTTYGLFVRVRSFAEHACTEQTTNPFRNTRTTAAGLLARLTVAPFRVNYHLEHHLLVAVPWHKLPETHRLLARRGALEDAMLAPSYAAVVRTVTRRAAARA